MLSVETRGKILVLKMIGVLKQEHLDAASDLVNEKLQETENGLILVDMRRYEGAEDLKTMWKEFKLITANSASENAVIAQQKVGEELLIKLRGKVYLIK